MSTHIPASQLRPTDHLARLLRIAEELGSAVVAFSGGVDSSLALYACAKALGNRCVAATGLSPSLAPEELDDAVALAESLSVRLVTIETQELDVPGYRDNTLARCFHCKNELYSQLRSVATQQDLTHIVDGTNLDDLSQPDRPGGKAARALGVRSILAEAGLDKDAVRAVARHVGLSTWDKPAMACLSSRIPFGTEITEQKLKAVAQSESALRQLGFLGARVRHHGKIARIELPVEQIPHLLEDRVRHAILEAVRAAGFDFATLDLAGYSSGAFYMAATGQQTRSERGAD